MTNVRILVLDILLSQANERRIPPDVLPLLYKEYSRLAEVEKRGRASLYEYLEKANDGIPFEGIQNLKKIFKYRLTRGDRVLYTYGNPAYGLDMQKSDIILLGYAKHDDQEYFARNTNFFHRKNVTLTAIDKLASDINEVEADRDYMDSDGNIFRQDYLEFLANYWDKHYVLDHHYAVVNGDTFANLPIDQWDIVLFDEQKNIIKDFIENPLPTLVLGGAGTGKTIIGVRMTEAFQANNIEQKSIYITQSYELRQRVKELYAGVSHKDINCVNINDYCLNKLGKNLKQFIGTQQFISLFWSKDKELQKSCEKAQIDPMDIWTEIRGVIKGAMDSSWHRTKPQNQNDYRSSIKTLVDYGYLKRCEDDTRTFILAEDWYLLKVKAANDENLAKQDRNILDQAFDYFSGFDPTKVSLSRAEYLSLPEERSTIGFNNRPLVWNAFESYQHFLSENNMFDDNDLVRWTYELLTDEDKVDFVFVDEVQDYTELQLFFIHSLCNNGKQLVFAGDSNQNVNPTLFDEDRLKVLYSDNNRKSYLKVKHLSENHRCPQEVVTIANSIADLRRKTIGKKNQRSEEDAFSTRSGSRVWRLLYNDDNVTQLVKEFAKYPGTAILVPNEKVKDKLKKIASKSGLSNNFIFTVSEIKGMEYQFVVCYDLFGNYKTVWSQMIDNKSDFKHKSKYRFYFNLIYVAVTRSKVNLCFIDEKAIPPIDEILGLPLLNEFDTNVLSFSALKNELADWYNSAREYERNGMYSQAIEFYRNAKEFANEKDILRCQAELYVENREFEKAIKYALAAGRMNRAVELINELDEDSPLAYLVSCISNADKLTVEKVKKFGRLKKIIRTEFKDVEGANISEIVTLAIGSMRTSYLKTVTHLNTLLNGGHNGN